MQKGRACRQAGFAVLWIIVGILILAVVASGAYYLGRVTVPKTQPQSQIVTSSPQPTTSPVIDETASWKLFNRETLGVKFKYPPEFYYKETVAGTGYGPQRAIEFTNTSRQFFFDVYLFSDGGVPPYLETEQTKELNGEVWKVFTPKKGVQICDAGNCGELNPVYYTAKNGNLYQFTYKADELKPTIEQILSTFVFSTPDSNEGKQCGYLRGNPPLIPCPSGYECRSDMPGVERSSGQCVKLQ